MTPRFLRLVAVVALLATACGAEGPVAVDFDSQRLATPHRGRLVVECDYSHTNNDDPIVHPGDRGASHSHDFFGNTSVDADTTSESIYIDTDTSCGVKHDAASYWAPSLYVDGEQHPPESVDAYYRAGPGVDPADVEVYPAGLMVLAGDPESDRQPLRTVGWGCGQNTTRYHEPPVCGDEAGLTLRINFPDCWDGRRLDSPDHRAHMAQSGPEGCPESHPHPMLELEMVIQYGLSGELDDLALSSGPVTTAHADFLNGWDTEKLQRDIELCIHREIVCAVTGVGS